MQESHCYSAGEVLGAVAVQGSTLCDRPDIEMTLLDFIQNARKLRPEDEIDYLRWTIVFKEASDTLAK